MGKGVNLSCASLLICCDLASEEDKKQREKVCLCILFAVLFSPICLSFLLFGFHWSQKRIHRTGQTRDCRFVQLILKDSLEESMFKNPRMTNREKLESLRISRPIRDPVPIPDVSLLSLRSENAVKICNWLVEHGHEESRKGGVKKIHIIEIEKLAETIFPDGISLRQMEDEMVTVFFFFVKKNLTCFVRLGFLRIIWRLKKVFLSDLSF